jgi:enoyl-CoA hydratase/carnithine racemase
VARERAVLLPCVIVAVDRPGGSPVALADLVVEPTIATVDDVVAVVEANPIAATSLVLLLRSTEQARVVDGLAAESAVYSMLQGGPEFAGWRTSRPRRDRPPSGRPAVRVERLGDRLDVVLDRPEIRNALNREMRDGILEALAVAECDPTIATVTLRGEGPSFCSGGDLDEFGSYDDPASAHLVRLTTSIGGAIHRLDGRVRAEVHGPCAGSGIELPAFASHVTARPDFRASLPEVTLGLVPGAGGTISLPRRIGRQRTALLALSAAEIDADTALAWGLVDEIVAPADLN